MTQFLPISGTIQQINWHSTDPQQLGCMLNLSIFSREHGPADLLLSGYTYVPDGTPFSIGDEITFFYSASAPVPLIYPPQYQAAVAVPTPPGSLAALDTFTQHPETGQLSNSDDTLRLNVSDRTVLQLPNGQPFGGALSGKLLLVLYSITTNSIPPQTPPERIIVFCQ